MVPVAPTRYQRLSWLTKFVSERWRPSAGRPGGRVPRSLSVPTQDARCIWRQRGLEVHHPMEVLAEVLREDFTEAGTGESVADAG